MALLECSEKSGEYDTLSRSQTLRLAILLAILTVWGQRVCAQESADEYQVRAAYLYNFGRFVQWPVESFLTPSVPLVIGVIGEHPFHGTLDEVLRGKAVNGHPIQIRRLRWNEPLTACHILFISSSESEHLPYILKNLSGQSVLTISDLEGFSLGGGMIEFRMVGNRVRFDINWAATQDARLDVSAKLLNVARAVHADKRKVTP
jgi:hypothetical protein